MLFDRLVRNCQILFIDVRFELRGKLCVFFFQIKDIDRFEAVPLNTRLGPIPELRALIIEYFPVSNDRPIPILLRKDSRLPPNIPNPVVAFLDKDHFIDVLAHLLDQVALPELPGFQAREHLDDEASVNFVLA